MLFGRNYSGVTSPTDTVLLTQLSDGADYLNLVSEELFAFTLKLNLLFFSQIALGSADLLGNKRFYHYCRHEKQAMQRLFAVGPDGDSPLCPVLWNHNESLTEVAERMIAARTIHSLASGEQLTEHAGMLDALKPRFLHTAEDSYRDQYHRLTKYLLMKTLDESDASIARFLPEKRAAQEALQWCEAFADGARFTCSGFYRFIDARGFEKEDNTRLKHVGDTVAHYAQSSMLNTRISVPEQISPIITALRKTAPLSGVEDRIEEEEMATEFPIVALNRLSLQDVLALRDTASVREARQHLNRFRGDGAVDKMALREALDHASSGILEYAFSRPVDRRHWLRLQANKAGFLRMRLIFNVTAQSAPVALAFFAPADQHHMLLTVMQTAIYKARTAYDQWGDKTQGRNMAHIPEFNPSDEVIYRPGEGGVGKGDV